MQLWEACDLYRPSYINAGLWTAPDRDEAARRLRVLCREAAQRGMAVALEFVPYSGIPTLADAWHIVEGSGCDNAGLVLDLWHAHRSGTSPREVRAIPARSWLAVQLGDAAPRAWPDMREESRHGRLLPGEGCIDIGAYLGALADTGAQPCFAVEVISDELHALDSRECCARLAAAAATVLRAANCQARLPARHANIIGATT